jgi:hypothetical protein
MEKLNIQSIQAVLWEEIQKVREGSTTAANVNAITNATGKILSSVKLHVEYCKLTGKTPEVDLFLVPSEKKSEVKAIK